MLVQMVGSRRKGLQVLKMVGNNHKRSIGVADDRHQP
jgi:hypothetical protein